MLTLIRERKMSINRMSSYISLTEREALTFNK